MKHLMEGRVVKREKICNKYKITIGFKNGLRLSTVVEKKYSLNQDILAAVDGIKEEITKVYTKPEWENITNPPPFSPQEREEENRELITPEEIEAQVGIIKWED